MDAKAWKETSFDLAQWFSLTTRIPREEEAEPGPSPVLTVMVYADDKNTSRHVLKIDEGSFFMGPSDLYLKEKKDEARLKAYRTYAIGLVSCCCFIWKPQR